MKIAVFSSKKTVCAIKRHLSENLTFQNLLKNRKLLPAEKFGNILAFEKESKRKLLSLILADSFIKNNLLIYIIFRYMTFWVEISFMLKRKIF